METFNAQTGAIPGIPTVTGVTIFLLSMQILLSSGHPWLPAAIKGIAIDRDTLSAGIDKIQPAVKHVDRFLMPRWLFMRQVFFRSLIALCCAICGLMMIPLELIPFLGLIPSFAVLIMAIGMATDDGAVALLGLSFAAMGLVMGSQQIIAISG